MRIEHTTALAVPREYVEHARGESRPSLGKNGMLAAASSVCSSTSCMMANSTRGDWQRSRD